jgi:hypothetical protein
MTEADYQRELLKAKIDAHRTVLGLEVRAARSAFDPLGLALSLLGFDRQTVQVLGPILHAVAGSLGDHVESTAPAPAAAPDADG